jgi:hypothetical protein
MQRSSTALRASSEPELDVLGDDKAGDLKLQAYVGSAAGRQKSVALQYGAAVEPEPAAVEADRRVLSHAVYLALEVGAIAVPLLAMSDWAAQARFSLRGKIHLEVLANAVAGLMFVAAVLEAIPPVAGEGARLC